MTKKAAMPYARSLALSLIAAAALAGCGSSSSPTGSSSGEPGGVEVAAVRSPLFEARDTPHAQHGNVVSSSDPITTGNAPSVARYPNGEDNDETTGTGTAPVKPCGLVSRGQASAILGGPVRVTLEPRGPTCVFAARRSKQVVTLVVENIRFAGLRSHARQASRVQVAGQTGWCLRYGSTSVAVPLAAGRVLHVTGSCAAAASFAARALRHL